MRIAIPIFSGRVAPRFSIAEKMLLLDMAGHKILTKQYLQLGSSDLISLIKLLLSKRADLFVCGGISRENKKYAESEGIEVVDNVACSEQELCCALEQSKLRPGYGFIPASNGILDLSPKAAKSKTTVDFNCLRCVGRECESGMPCPAINGIESRQECEKEALMLETAHDIALEEERKLCRLSEVIYYGLDMKYRKIGVAYCIQLREATEILVSVLRRFFDVAPVCCKVMGRVLSDNLDSPGKVACNPKAQAEVLNRIGTDFNIMSGLCVGCDSLFAMASSAPVTSLFVKDKSLANNPIGALYSDYYLKEIEDYVIH
ncbi:MAG: DUF1847 domain-containing protein [Candidatus Kapaibacterium sp.]